MSKKGGGSQPGGTATTAKIVAGSASAVWQGVPRESWVLGAFGM